MASPIENVHTFDLHFTVGSVSWPDDLELYCEVTFPGLDAEHPIERNYMHMTSSYASAIQKALEDIKAYMDDPTEWIEEHIKHQGTTWEKRKLLELEIEEYQHSIEYDQKAIINKQERITRIEQQIQALEKEQS